MSFTRVWSDREEEILCGNYMRHRKDFQNHVGEVVDELHKAGFTDKTPTTTLAKLRDYDRIAKRKDTKHVAKASIKTYERMNQMESELKKGLEGYLREVYAIDGKITDYDIEISFTDLKNGSLPQIDLSFTGSRTTAFVIKDVNMRLGLSFFDELMFLLNRDGRDNADIYNSAEIDRRTFSKILQGKSVSKRNLVKLAIALKLNMDDANELLSSAGFAFTKSCKMDVVIMYAIEHGIYDLFEIEEALYECGEPTLFYAE